MKKKIKELFTSCPDNWSYADLKAILADLEEGGENTKETIKELISEMEGQTAICATCGQVIDLDNNPFILEFGPPEMRKEACFCALDCMEYFIKQVKQIKINDDF